MPQVDIVITKDLSYSTRRLKAGDRLSVSEQDAKVLVGIGKAERAREPGIVAAPPPELLTRAMEATPAAPVPAMSVVTVAPSPKAASRRKRAVKKRR